MIPDGIFMLSSFPHPLNAPSPRVLSPSGNFTNVRLEQSPKLSYPMVVSVLGKLTDSRLLNDEKAPLPIVVTPSGITNVFIFPQ